MTNIGRSLIYKVAVRLFMMWPFAEKRLTVRQKMTGHSQVDEVAVHLAVHSVRTYYFR